MVGAELSGGGEKGLGFDRVHLGMVSEFCASYK